MSEGRPSSTSRPKVAHQDHERSQSAAINLANDNLAPARYYRVQNEEKERGEVREILPAESLTTAQYHSEHSEPDWQPPSADVHETVSVTGAADLGAGAIGSLAGYLADEMAELFAPTPPEIRDARAKAADRDEAVQEDAAGRARFNAYARAAESAIRRADEERETERTRVYWEERERQKDR